MSEYEIKLHELHIAVITEILSDPIGLSPGFVEDLKSIKASCANKIKILKFKEWKQAVIAQN